MDMARFEAAKSYVKENECIGSMLFPEDSATGAKKKKIKSNLFFSEGESD